MKKLLFILLLLPAISATAQSGFLVKVINLNDSINQLAIGNTGKLQATLIDGFLNGKLKGYKVAYKKEPVYGVIQQWPNPPAWQKEYNYNDGDTVTYQGKFYRYLSQEWCEQKGFYSYEGPPGIHCFWGKPYQRSAPIISFNCSWPGVDEELSKQEFDSLIILRQREVYPIWKSTEVYYTDDLVQFNSKHYFAVSNSEGKVPTDMSFWMVTDEGDELKMTPRDFNVIHLLTYADSAGKVNSNIVGLVVEFSDRSAAKQINFYYSDVVAFMKSKEQKSLKFAGFDKLKADTVYQVNQLALKPLANSDQPKSFKN